MRHTCAHIYNTKHCVRVLFIQRTALYLACAEGRPKCAEFLITKGAMVTYWSREKEEVHVMSCLNVAIDANHK